MAWQCYWHLSDCTFCCITESFLIGKGDILVFCCALVFSVHILVIDHFSPKVDGVKMSCIQFFVSGILSLPFMFVLETPRLVAVAAAWMPLLYAGVLSCGVAYTLQILGQKNVNPAVASLILSLESCFSVLAGWIILGERLSFRESLGCILMFLAIILAQLPDKKIMGNRRRENAVCDSESYRKQRKSGWKSNRTDRKRIYGPDRCG